MCKCTPERRTPFCGAPGCEMPTQKQGPAPPARLGTAKGKRVRRKARAAQGFELNPPRCLNCSHLQPPKFGVPGSPNGGGYQYTAMACKIGNFQVKAWSICDLWTGRDGETLAGA